MSSRRFTAQCLRDSTEKDSTTGGSAAVRDFNPAYDRYGSSATEAVEAARRCMSASLQKLTSERLPRYVRFVPRADISLPTRPPRRRGRGATKARRDRASGRPG